MVSRNPDFSDIVLPDGSVLLRTICPFCGKEQSMTFKGDKALKYKTGKIYFEAGYLIQDAWPEFSPDEREFILTGICPECWNSISYVSLNGTVYSM